MIDYENVKGWFANRQALKGIDLLYDIHGELYKKEEYEKATAVSCAITVLDEHKGEYTKSIKNGIEVTRSLNRFGRFLRKFVKVHEELECISKKQ